MLTSAESVEEELHLGDNPALSNARPRLFTPARPSTSAAIPVAAAQLSGPPKDSSFGLI